MLEAEADAMGARLLAEQGYPPLEMATTWQQLIGELDLSARYRRKPRERDLSLFSTHPAPESRMRDLRATAAELTVPGRLYDNGRARYLQAIAPIRQMLLDDQVKLNDPGATPIHHQHARPGRLERAAALSTRARTGGFATGRATTSAPRKAMRSRSLIPTRRPMRGAGTGCR